MNKISFILIGYLLLVGCATPSMPEPSKLANSDDPESIQQFDERMRTRQMETVNSHTGGFESKFILWNNIECMRRVYIAQARAAYVLASDQGIPLSSAQSQISSDPRWISALNSCR